MAGHRHRGRGPRGARRGPLVGVVAAGSVVVLSLLPAERTAADVPTVTTIAVESFGGHADDGVDDTAALQAALDALPEDGRLLLGPGTYQHDDVLVVRVRDVVIAGRGARLLATDEQRSAFHVAASGVLVDDLVLDVATTTRRWFAPDQMKLRVSASTGVVLRDVVVEGSAAAGIYIGDGARAFRVERPVVRDTRADGIHMTGAAQDGLVDRPTTTATGDDGVAVVSYGTDPGPCRDIVVHSPRVLGTLWGRGISVVGGENVTYTDITVRDTDSAGVYVGVEPDPYLTRSVRGVRISGGTVDGANRNAAVEHGAVVAYLGRVDHELTDVHVDGLRITGTRSTAPSQVTVRSAGSPPRFLTFSGLEFEGAPATRYGGDVAPGLYGVSG